MSLRPPSLRLVRRQPAPLLVRARTDPDAFAGFYDRYAERILIFLTRRVLDAEVALDLMSETFAKAFEHREQFRGKVEEEEQAWLYAIARSELSLYWRRGRTEHGALLRLGVPVPSLTDAEIERIEELAELRTVATELEGAMKELSPEQAEAVTLRVVQEKGYAEIAAETNVSQQVVRARVSRGLRQLAGSLDAEGAEDAA